MCTFIPFLSNQNVPCHITSKCKTTVISRLSTNPIMDQSLKSMKDNIYSKNRVRALSTRNEEISKVKLCNIWMIHLILHCLFLATQSFVFELYRLSTWLSVIESLYSFKLLFEKARSDLVLNNN